MATVVRKINAEKFMGILKEEAADIFEACTIVESDDGDKVVSITLDEENEDVCIFAFAEDMISGVIPLDAEPNYELVNRFNNESVFVTAIIDEDNATLLRSVLALEPGVTTENIVMFVKLMLDSLNTYNEIIG